MNSCLNTLKNAATTTFLFAAMISTALAGPLETQVFEPSVQIGNYCSGEIISSEREPVSGDVATIVLTAKHCVLDEKGPVEVNKAVYDEQNRKTGVKTYIADVLGKSFKSDLAVLRLRDKDALFMQTASVAPKDMKLSFGQDVAVVGYPLGGSMTYTKGSLGYVEEGMFGDISKSKQFYRATPDIAPGSSGSSMFTQTETGEYVIIGITTGGFRGVTFMNFFTPIEEIHDYLDVAKKTFAWPLDKKE